MVSAHFSISMACPVAAGSATKTARAKVAIVLSSLGLPFGRMSTRSRPSCVTQSRRRPCGRDFKSTSFALSDRRKLSRSISSGMMNAFVALTRSSTVALASFVRSPARRLAAWAPRPGLFCRRVERFRGVSKCGDILLVGGWSLRRRIQCRTKGSFCVADECQFSALIGRNEAFDCARLGDFRQFCQFARNCFGIIMRAREHLRGIGVDRGSCLIAERSRPPGNVCFEGAPD